MMPKPSLLYFSPSRLQKYVTCPMSYYFQYIEGIQSPTNGEAHKGGCFHRAVEESWKYKKDPFLYGKSPVEEAKAIFVDSFDHPVDFSKNEIEIDWKKKDPEDLKQEGLQLLVAYLKSPEWENLFPKDFEKEVNFLLDTRSLLVCDMAGNEELLLNSDIVHIKNRLDVIIEQGFMDMKTSRARYTGFDVISKLQFNLYSIAYLVLQYSADLNFVYPVKNRCDVIVKTKAPYVQSFVADYNQVDFSMTLKYLSGIIKGIKNEVFYPNVNQLCANYCSYRDLCQPRAKLFDIEGI